MTRSKINFPPKQCLYCGVLFWRRSGERACDFRTRKFCIREHYFLWMRGPNHPNFKNGIKTRPDGYLRRTSDEQYVHRLVMEAHLGRPLTPDEFIHHIDGDRSNNHISNLGIMSNAEHRVLHVADQSRDTQGRFV